MASQFTYSIENDTLNSKIAPRKLHNSIASSDINIALEGVSTSGDDLNINFKDTITPNEKNILDNIVSQHDGIAGPEDPQTVTFEDTDSTGRPVIRYAATNKGWHYQAHSIQFEVNLLSSIYNKGKNGNDLGYSEIKVYDDQGNECTTQSTADTDGVKTVVTWKPDFDFEIISGQVKQLEKETIDSYLYVSAQVNTGAGYLEVPFTEGGLNLNYIGTNEQLKTDGRASKFFNGTNNDYFEFTVNYPADALTNTNRHKMSIILEIYKSPKS